MDLCTSFPSITIIFGNMIILIVSTLLPILPHCLYLSSSSSMDLVLNSTNMSLTSQLVQVTGAGEFAGEEILDSKVLWSYEVPHVDRNEFIYEGTYSDETPPTFTPLSYANGSSCIIRQLANRDYDDSAFEIEYSLEEPQSHVDVTYRVGYHDYDDRVISETRLQGSRVVVPHSVPTQHQPLVLTLSAVNSNNMESHTYCTVAVYDQSPPLARITPISTVSSHPQEFKVLLTLFDEYGLSGVQQIAVGTSLVSTIS